MQTPVPPASALASMAAGSYEIGRAAGVPQQPLQLDSPAAHASGSPGAASEVAPSGGAVMPAATLMQSPALWTSSGKGSGSGSSIAAAPISTAAQAAPPAVVAGGAAPLARSAATPSSLSGQKIVEEVHSIPAQPSNPWMAARPDAAGGWWVVWCTMIPQDKHNQL